MVPNDPHWMGFARQIATVPEEQAAAAAAFIETQRDAATPFLLQVSFTQCAHSGRGSTRKCRNGSPCLYLPDTESRAADLANPGVADPRHGRPHRLHLDRHRPRGHPRLERRLPRQPGALGYGRVSVVFLLR